MKKLLILVTILLFGFQCASAQSGNLVEINSVRITKKVKIFPNPAVNVVNILGLQNSNRADIIITDTYGNIVLQHHWSIKNKALNIPITSISSGMYTVSISSAEQKVRVKFFKQ